MDNVERLGQFAVVDVSRSPTGRTAWSASAIHCDRCECLTASGSALHVFALGEGQGQLSIDRPLRIRERASIQGFSAPTSTSIRDEIVGRRAFGNAMAVPVLGCVLARELRLMAMSTIRGTSMIRTLSPQSTCGQTKSSSAPFQATTSLVPTSVRPDLGFTSQTGEVISEQAHDFQCASKCWQYLLMMSGVSRF